MQRSSRTKEGKDLEGSTSPARHRNSIGGEIGVAELKSAKGRRRQSKEKGDEYYQGSAVSRSNEPSRQSSRNDSGKPSSEFASVLSKMSMRASNMDMYDDLEPPPNVSPRSRTSVETPVEVRSALRRHSKTQEFKDGDGSSALKKMSVGASPRASGGLQCPDTIRAAMSKAQTRHELHEDDCRIAEYIGYSRCPEFLS